MVTGCSGLCSDCFCGASWGRMHAAGHAADRLLEFLGRAETVEEIIALEERLSEVRYQLESMESQLRTMDNLIEYSTVKINISEVRELTVVKEEEPTAWERIAEGFLKSLSNIGNGIEEAGIWFLVNIPYLLIWAVIIGLGIWGWLRHRRARLKELSTNN